METNQILQDMLTENTGRHMLDSGGAYGRNWERNQEVDFEARPRATVDEDLTATIDVYHWMSERLELATDLDARFQEFCASEDRERTSYLQDMEEFVEENFPDATGLYGSRDPFTVNTYNHDCALSQTLQFHFFELSDTPYVILQVHGGCDVRGGYTAPRVFEVVDDAASIVSWGDVSLGCTECDARWYTQDGGYHWHNEDCGSDLDAGRLEKDEKGRHKCPVCEKGHLEAY